MVSPAKSIPQAEHVKQHTVEILKNLPATFADLVIKAELPLHTVKYRIKVMRADNLCHRGGWERVTGTGGKFMPVFHAGPGKDVRCQLKPLTSKQYDARARKKRKNTEAGELRLAKGRARQWRLKAERVGDPLVNALFGRNQQSN